MNDKSKAVQEGANQGGNRAEEREFKAPTSVSSQARETAKPKEDDLRVWLGPTIGAAVRRGVVIKGQMPAELKKLVEQMPEAAVLYVSLNSVFETKRRLESPCTAEGQLFEKIRKEWNDV